MPIASVKQQHDKKLLAVSMLLLLAFGTCRAQSPRFSQFKAVPLMVNPALAATVPDITFQACHRQQRFGSVRYQTTYFSSVLPLYQQGQEAVQVGGLGLSAGNDQAGTFGEVKTTEAHLTGAYLLAFDEYRVNTLTFGLQAGFVQTRVDFGTLHWPSQMTYKGFDPSKTVDLDAYEQGFGIFTIAAGAFWTYNPNRNPFRQKSACKAYAGFSVANLNEPAYTLVADANGQVAMRYSLQASTEHALSDRVSLAPSVFFISQYHYRQYSAGATLHFAKTANSMAQSTPLTLRFGTWYRQADALVFLTGVGNRKFDVAFSYDVSVNGARAAVQSQQALEVSLAYRLLHQPKLKKLSSPLF